VFDGTKCGHKIININTIGQMNLTNEFQPIRDWATARNLYEQGDVKTQALKLVEEVGEIARAILRGDTQETIDGIGDATVVLVNLAALVNRDLHVEASEAGAEMNGNITLESCVNTAYEVIKDRKGRMVNGTFDRTAEPLEL